MNTESQRRAKTDADPSIERRVLNDIHDLLDGLVSPEVAQKRISGFLDMLGMADDRIPFVSPEVVRAAVLAGVYCATPSEDARAVTVRSLREAEESLRVPR